MNRLILVEREKISESIYRLTDRKANHILKILKSNIGDSLKAGLWNSSIGLARIESIDKEKREVFVSYQEEEKEIKKAGLSQLRVFSALQRPQTTKKIIQFCANCGILDLFFFPAEKSELSYLQSSIWTDESLEEEIILWLEQGGRVLSPNIQILKNKYRITDHLVNENRFILNFNHNYIDSFQNQISKTHPLHIVIGPESGFIEEDVKYFKNLSFKEVSVSENILRSEIALMFFAAQLELTFNLR